MASIHRFETQRLPLRGRVAGTRIQIRYPNGKKEHGVVVRKECGLWYRIKLDNVATELRADWRGLELEDTYDGPLSRETR